MCTESKTPGAFAQRYRAPSTDPYFIRRCKSCSERCSECNQYMADDRGSATGTSKCWHCDAKSRMRKCARCGETKTSTAYDPSVLHNHVAHHRHLICLECQKQGYSSDPRAGLKTYHCMGGHSGGHKLFDGKLLENIQQKRTSLNKLICKECKQRPKYQCSIARPNYDQPECYEWDFNEQRVQNFKKQKRGTTRLVCNACVELGFTSKRGGDTVRRYKCSIQRANHNQPECDETAFPEQQLKTYRPHSGRTRLVCHACSQSGFTTRHGGDTVRRCDICRQELGPQKFESTKSCKLVCKDCKKKPYRNDTA